MKNNKKKLGQILLELDAVAEDDIKEALKQQKKSKLRIGDIFLQKGKITETIVLKALSIQSGVDYIEEIKFSLKDEFVNKIPFDYLKNNSAIPFNITKKEVHIAVNDPYNINLLDDLILFYPDHQIKFFIAPHEKILSIINEKMREVSETSTKNFIDEIEEDEYDFSTAIDETEDILEMGNEAPIIRLVNKVITEAVKENASDIHLEPYEKELNIRFRIDGILYSRFSPPKKIQSAIISRIKIMSNLNIAENRLPQDGRIQIKIGNRDIDIRVSIFPTQFGERIVLRLLNKTDMNYNFENLGFSKEIHNHFKKQIAIPHGITLVTGPTGSGKSTTLYSVLTKINSADINILTVEDPIEYQIQGIGQMQVHPKINLTFATGLRSILRQDPDVIMVGEIRDVETAEIAVQSALTGHRVFSTIHTNDAASAVTRLLDMGIEPFLIASSINSFVAQRLVRRICNNCKTSYSPSAKLKKELGITSTKKTLKFYKGKGCDKCFETGYSGRTGIYELLVVNNDIKKLIIEKADSERIKNAAVKNGMTTLLDDGIEKIMSGMTTVDEVLRVTI